MQRHTWFVIAMLTFALLAIDVVGGASWFPFDDAWRWLFVVVMGFCVAQVNLIAIWAALAPGRVMLRLPWSIFLATLMWYATVLGSRISWFGGSHLSYGSRIDLGDAILLGIIILAGVVSVQVPLWAASRWFAWRLTPPVSTIAPRDDERQFNLKHLIAGMVLASVALGLGRVVLPADEEFRLAGLDRELTVIVPAMLIVNLIAIVPCIWIAFASWPRMALLILGWSIYAIVVSVTEIGVLATMLGPPPGDIWFLFTLFNLSQGVCVLIALWVLRRVGFRLVRWTAAGKLPAATVTPQPALDIMQPPIVASEIAIAPVEQPP